MDKKNYNNLVVTVSVLVVLFLHPSHIFADSFKTSDPSVASPYEDLLIPFYSSDNVSTDWQYVNKLKGINNFQKNIAGTKSKAYKGVCVINSPIKTIYSIIADVKNHKQWVKYCKSSKMIKQTSPDNSTQYYQFDIPWPFSNRDMVINSTTDVSWDKGKVIITSVASHQSDIPKKETFIRVVESKQKWVLEQIGPNSTKVTFTSYTPLSTSDSSLLKKIASTTIPFSTLEQLKTLSAQKYKTDSSDFIVKSNTDTNNKKEFKAGAYN